jgi:formiminotetrahydrofolate cyclodeaminase
VAHDLANRTLHDVLSAFAAAVPTPGGGSACAASSAIGVALLMKVASVAGVPRHPLAGIQAQLVDAIDDDATAYQDVVTAYKRPRDSQADRALRTAAVQRALVHATDVPLTIMRLSAEALTEARSIAPKIHRSTAADATVALLLLRAGFEGARTTVDANLSGLADAEHAVTVRDECRRLSEKAAQGSGEAERLLLRVG